MKHLKYLISTFLIFTLTFSTVNQVASNLQVPQLLHEEVMT